MLIRLCFYLLMIFKSDNKRQSHVRGVVYGDESAVWRETEAVE